MNYNQIIQAVDVVVELEHLGLDYQIKSDHEVATLCPFHEDTSPSCFINTESKLFMCQTAGCKSHGDIITFVAKRLNVERSVMLLDVIQRYKLDTDKAIDVQTIERFHEALKEHAVLLKQLYKRGVSDEDIRKYRLGQHEGRITIPIRNKFGNTVNVRKYLPGAPARRKMANMKGRGKIRLFPIAQMKYDKLVFVGGEIKAIATASRMNRHDIGAFATTGGEENWDMDFNEEIAGKTIYICLDVDQAGQLATEKMAKLFSRLCKEVYIVRLPLDIEKYPTGDVNDYFGMEKATDKDFLALLNDSELWVEPSESVREDGPPEVIAFKDVQSSSLVAKKIEFEAVVSTVDSAPYVLPSLIIPKCDRHQPMCSICPVFFTPKDSLMRIPADSEHVLSMASATKKTLRPCVREALGVPPCDSFDFEAKEYETYEETQLVAKLEIGVRESTNLVQPAICKGLGIEGNVSYRMVGHVYPDPRTQQSKVLVKEWEPTNDALSSYSPSTEELEELRIFRPKAWTVDGIQSKLDELYNDIEANVTNIFLRRNLHLAVDLAYHSILVLPIDGRSTKGWVETLILGDSSQGKTDAIQRMMGFYGLGERLDCKNATVPGLLGGLQQVGTRWHVAWGIIPTHDKRLVVLEELKGASTEILSKLTDMRSSGVAEIPKIEKRRTHARTRLICVSNPRRDRVQVASYSFGVEALRELMGGLEDLRRFDLNLVLSANQITPAEFSRIIKHRPRVDHVHTSDLCRRCILWAWSRTEDHVIIDSRVEAEIFDAAERLTSEFTEVIPILDKGSTRLKIARLAASLAARTFSSNDSYDSVLVRRCHVQYIEQFLRTTYSDEYFGYREFSKAIELTTTVANPESVKKAILATTFPRELVQCLSGCEAFDARDLCDWCSWEMREASDMISIFVRNRAVQRDKKHNVYRKTPGFIALLKSMTNIPERPSHVGEDF